jgi:hypothetical protein
MAKYVGERGGVRRSNCGAAQNYQRENCQPTPRRSDLSASGSLFRHLHVNPPKLLKNLHPPFPAAANKIDADSLPVGS